MKQRPKILLLVPHLGGGGAEQVTLLLANKLCPDKYELHLGLITQLTFSSNHLPPSVRIHLLSASRVRAAALPLLRLIRNIKPDLILSGIAHLNFLVLMMRPLFPRQTRVLARQNGTASASVAFGNLPRYTPLLYRRLYRHADRVICQTAAMAADLAEVFAIPTELLSVLPNPVDIESIQSVNREAPKRWMGQASIPSGPHLLAIGRLSREKGFDLLLHALVTVREHFPHAELTIAGTGPEEDALKAQCRALSLEPAVRFAGYLARPSALFPTASIFVLSSRHEGLPNALLEAAAAGLPIVALPASAGVVDLLRGHKGVWLAPEVSAGALAETLLTALDALQPGERFAHPFIADFAIDRAIHAYEALIDSVLAEPRR